jgi:lipopolysaccharide heptosyltransferase II
VSRGRRTARLSALRLVGPILATLGRRSARLARPAEQHVTSDPPRILLIRPDHLGDVLLATPAAAVLHQALLGSRIDWLVGPWSAEVAQRAGGASDVMTLDFPGFTRRPKRSAVEPYVMLLRQAKRLSARGYDAALVLRPDHWWGAMLASAAGVPRRFGFSVAECQPFLTDTLPAPAGHVVRANLELARLAARRLGGTVASDSTLATPRYPISNEAAAWADDLHARLDQRAAALVAIHPGTGAALKNWLPECWADVAGTLRTSHGAQLVLTGGPGEGATVEAIAGRLDPRPVTLVGATTLDQLAALYARCDLVVGGDSGPLHLAAAVGTPTVRLYGPTDVREFGPWPPAASHVALTAGLSCQPCRELVAPPCGAREAPACMRALGVEAVVGAAAGVLERRQPAAPDTPVPGEPR